MIDAQQRHDSMDLLPDVFEARLQKRKNFSLFERIGSKGKALALWTAIVCGAWFVAGSAALVVVPPFDIGALGVAPLPVALPVEQATPAEASPESLLQRPLKLFAQTTQSTLFQSRIHAPAAKAAAAPVAVKALNAVLLGTVNAQVPEWQRAVLLFQGKQYVMRVGQTLDGFTLERIERRAVVLKNGEKEVVLRQDGDAKAPVAK